MLFNGDDASSFLSLIFFLFLHLPLYTSLLSKHHLQSFSPTFPTPQSTRKYDTRASIIPMSNPSKPSSIGPSYLPPNNRDLLVWRPDALASDRTRDSLQSNPPLAISLQIQEFLGKKVLDLMMMCLIPFNNFFKPFWEILHVPKVRLVFGFLYSNIFSPTPISIYSISPGTYILLIHLINERIINPIRLSDHLLQCPMSSFFPGELLSSREVEYVGKVKIMWSCLQSTSIYDDSPKSKKGCQPRGSNKKTGVLGIF